MADNKKSPERAGKKSFNWPDRIFGAMVLILSILVFIVIAGILFGLLCLYYIQRCNVFL